MVYMRTVLAMMATLVALTVLAGCGGKSVVGKWDLAMSSTDPQMGVGLAAMGTMKEAMEFKDDDSFAVTVVGNTMEGTYKMDGNKVILAPKEGAPGLAKDLTLSEDGNTMTGTEGLVTMTLTRPVAK